MKRPVVLGKVAGAALLALALASLTGQAPPASAQAGGATYTVNSTADDPDRSGGNGSCATASGACTLRAALAEANAHSGPDRIAFNIPGSGTNGRIAFHSDRTGNQEIWTVNADGTGPKNLTNNPAVDASPDFSPDGGKVVFRSERDGNSEIYAMNADGTGQRRLTNNPVSDASPDFSPDGRRIVFTSTLGGDRELFVMNADGTGQRPITANAVPESNPEWSPDGTKIAFTRTVGSRASTNEIYTMNPDGTEEKRLTNNAFSDDAPDWRPDSQRIAFHSDRAGNYDVRAVDPDGTNVARLTDDRRADVFPSFSPDGRRIAFGKQLKGNAEIYTMNANGSRQTRLTNNVGNDDAPDWQPLAAPSGSDVRTIQLASELPALTDDGTTIDGYTQPGSAPNTDPLASNAKIGIEVRGSGPAAHDGLTVLSSDNVLKGLAFYNLHAPLNLDGRRGPAGADRNLISGCFIGTDAAGDFGFPERTPYAHGIYMRNGAAENRIGEATLAGRNVVSGNGSVGIYTRDPGTARNVVVNNIVGLSPDGTRGLPNYFGIDINLGSSENVVGGDGTLERNVVSGNANEGVEISHTPGSADNRVVGNFIGTDLTGTRADAQTANGTFGIQVQDEAQRNVFRANVVGGNRSGGVHIEGGPNTPTINNVFEGNWIGASRGGAPIPNAGPGVVINNRAARNRLGPGNVIAHNAGNGVTITGYAENDFDTITRNSIYANGGLGIDLAPVGQPNANDASDADSGPNDQLNFPVFSAGPSGANGTACAGCTVELFASEAGTDEPGEGKTFLGSAKANDDGRFTAPLGGLEEGDRLTATATDEAGNTSEFSPDKAVSVTLASDDFGRAISSGWGTADTGGPYALLGPAGDFDVDGSAGTMLLPAAGAERGAILGELSARDTEALIRVKTDKPAVGGPQITTLVTRRAGGDEYRARVLFRPDGGVRLQAAKLVDGGYATLSAEASVPGLTHRADAWYRLRAQAVGANPTTIRVKAWADGQPEPAGWQYTATDSEPALQGPGAPGLQAHLAPSMGNAPVSFSFDGYRVGSPTP